MTLPAIVGKSFLPKSVLASAGATPVAAISAADVQAWFAGLRGWFSVLW